MKRIHEGDAYTAAIIGYTFDFSDNGLWTRLTLSVKNFVIFKLAIVRATKRENKYIELSLLGDRIYLGINLRYPAEKRLAKEY